MRVRRSDRSWSQRLAQAVPWRSPVCVPTCHGCCSDRQRYWLSRFGKRIVFRLRVRYSAPEELHDYRVLYCGFPRRYGSRRLQPLCSHSSINRTVMRRRLFLTGLSAMPLAACSRRTAQKFTRLSSDLQPFRDDFNRESGKTRVVMLLSPT